MPTMTSKDLHMNRINENATGKSNADTSTLCNDYRGIQYSK